MGLSPNQFDAAQFPAALRKDGWSPESRRFLALLAKAGNVRLAARCRMSAQSAYMQRRRDGLFARGSDAAIVLGRRHAEQVLADRAIDGVEEEIWHRGELIGTRRRYDTRLLLAHLVRLDRQAGARRTAEGADRFDEIVALVAGAEPPAGLEWEAGGLPPTRRAHVQQALEEAEEAALGGVDPYDVDDDDEEEDERVAARRLGRRRRPVDRLARAGLRHRRPAGRRGPEPPPAGQCKPVNFARSQPHAKPRRREDVARAGSS